MKEIKVGSRESALALWQTNWVIEQLQRYFPDYEFKVIYIKTQGDKILDVALAKIGDKGLFTKELEVALLNGQIDFAVHSMKDLPTVVPDGLTIGAITERANAADVLISPTGQRFNELPPGARIGTSSLRRIAQLRYARPDLEYVNLRGNLNTRLAKLDRGDYDAIVLAAAGVQRLGWEDRITEYLPFTTCLPAVGQGALGVEARADDREILDLLDKINHRPTAAAVKAERAFLRTLEGGCQIPIGAYGRVDGDKLNLTGLVAAIDGSRLIRGDVLGELDQPENLGRLMADDLLTQGADEILKQVRQETGI